MDCVNAKEEYRAYETDRNWSKSKSAVHLITDLHTFQSTNNTPHNVRVIKQCGASTLPLYSGKAVLNFVGGRLT